MKKKIKKIAILCVVSLSNFILAQQNKVGIGTETPTETLHVNGRARVQNLPEGNGAINTKENGTKGDNIFVPKYFVLADNNGVLGKVPKVDREGSESAGELNNSESIFVIKSYQLPDWPSGKNIDTQMSVNRWEAFMVFKGVRYKTHPSRFPFMSNQSNAEWGAYLEPSSGTYKIRGDINAVEENMQVSILFIKKDYIISSGEIDARNWN